MTWSKLWRAWQSSSTWRWSGSQTSAPTSKPSELDALNALGTMSSAWWRDQHQRNRVTFDGVVWAWPIRKDRDE